MKEFYRLLQVMKANQQTAMALATIIHVEGSAYRRAGAKMLFAGEAQYGTISAGCLESDLACRAQDVMSTQQSQTVTYDLRAEDDLSWGQGAGCNGKITVYLEPVAWGTHWAQMERLLDDGETILYAREIGETAKTAFFLHTENGCWNSMESKRRDNKAVFPLIRDFLQTKTGFAAVQTGESGGTLLLEIVEPKDRLYIFGAGPDAQPLVALAESMDFMTTVIDPRSSRCNAAFFPGAHRLVVAHPEAFLAAETLPVNSYVLIMTHNFGRDRTILQQICAQPLKYLGVLGPRRRTERLLVPDLLPDWVYSPVGLNIGADGPEEISVSIVAQLLQVRNENKTRARMAMKGA